MTDTPDYNDGFWHGWSGGECPVDQLSIVEFFFSDGEFGDCDGLAAGDWDWSDSPIATIASFRVIKQHKEPREFWADVTPNGIISHLSSMEFPGATLFREVKA